MLSEGYLLLAAAALATLPLCNSQRSPTIGSSTTTVSNSGGGGGSSTPVDVTAAAGGNATFTCYGQFVEWRVYTNPPKLLFSSRDNIDIENTNKYSIDGQWNLVVKNLDPNSDGQTYECRNGPTTITLANLVVIDENLFDVNISPSDQVLRTGDVVTFSCSVSYAGPTSDSSATKPLQPAQDPWLTLTLDDVSFAEMVVIEYSEPPGSSGTHVKIATVNHTLTTGDDGKTLKCTVRSLNYSKTIGLAIHVFPAAPPTALSTRSTTLPTSSTPVNVTAASGGNATFTCYGEFVEWRVYTNPPKTLFSSRDNIGIENTNKYSIDGQWNFVVKNLDPNSDGQTYECRTGPAATSRTLANLVVIDENLFAVSISPTNQVLRTGDVATFSCSVGYGGPTTDASAINPLQYAQDPHMTLTVDDDSIPEAIVEYMQPYGSSGIHLKIATVNHTLVTSNAGKTLKCKVTSLSYTKTVTRELNMLYAPNRFNSSLNSTGSATNHVPVNVGQTVRCYANGNPLPTVQWISLTDGVASPAPSNRKGYSDLIVPASPETQKWQCTAYNNQGNSSSTNPYIVYLRILSTLSTTLSAMQSVSIWYPTPVDVTSATGTNVTFICSGPFVEWTVYKHYPVLLFSSLFDVNIPDTSKYNISGQYNLVVRNIDPSNDGWTYGCRNTAITTTYANLVVVDERKLTANVSPSGQALLAGDVITFTCSVQYGGPTSDETTNVKPLDPSQDPRLTLTLDGESLPETTVIDYISPSGASRIHTKIATCNHTIVACDDGKSLVCSVTSLGYSQSVTFETPLFVAESLYFTNCSDNATSTSTPTGNIRWVASPLYLIPIMVIIIIGAQHE